MKEMFAIAIVFRVLMAILDVCDGRLCWMGMNEPIPYRYQKECGGSCLKRLCGKGCYEYGCYYTIIKPEGCTKCEDDVPCCFCNEPLCNKGPVPDRTEPISVNKGLNLANTASVSGNASPVSDSTDLVSDIADRVSDKTEPISNNVRPVPDNIGVVPDNIRSTLSIDVLRFLQDN